MRTRVPSAKRSRSSAARVCTSFSAARAFRLAARDAFLTSASVSRTERLLRDDVAADAELRGFVGKPEQRARVAHRERARREVRRAPPAAA